MIHDSIYGLLTMTNRNAAKPRVESTEAEFYQERRIGQTRVVGNRRVVNTDTGVQYLWALKIDGDLIGYAPTADAAFAQAEDMLTKRSAA